MKENEYFTQEYWNDYKEIIKTTVIGTEVAQYRIPDYRLERMLKDIEVLKAELDLAKKTIESVHATAVCSPIADVDELLSSIMKTTEEALEKLK